ncbi:phosphatase PAP2 family protein [Paenibacillus sp. strain BS8-2]
MMNWDYQLFKLINDAANNDSIIGKFMVLAANWGDYFFFFSLLLMLMFHRKMAIYGMISVGVTVLCSRWISLIYHRDRPFVIYEVNQLLPHVESNSFPSDHASAAFAIAMIFILFSKRIGWTYIGFAAIVSYSRIWVGKHYPLDVLAGTGLGIVIAVIVYRLLETYSVYDAVRSWCSRLLNSKKPQIDESHEAGM